MADSALGRDEILMPQLDYSQGDILLRPEPNPQMNIFGYPQVYDPTYRGAAPPPVSYPVSPYTDPTIYSNGKFGQGEFGNANRNPIQEEGPNPLPKEVWGRSPINEGVERPSSAPQFRGMPPQDEVLRDPQSALGNNLIKASYAGDVLAPYARGNARPGEPSSVEGIKDIFADRIKTMAADMPPNIAQKFGIISGFRNAARQHEVNPDVTNSRHMYGMAVDTTKDPDVYNWINNTNGKYGVAYTLRHLPNEQNHLEMVENGVRAPLPSTQLAQPAQPTQPVQPPSAAAADRTQEVATDQPSQLHPVFAYEKALEQFPVLHKQQLIAGPGKQLEYWPPNEPGTPDRPRPDYIPIDQSGMELGPNSTPLDILGDIVSHHMIKKDPVIKKHYESFKESLTADQKEQLQAQYNYATKNQNETRPYAAWEKSAGLPAYFRGYAFGQWPAEFNQKAYTPAQRYHFDRMMDYLRGNQHQQPPTALQ